MYSFFSVSQNTYLWYDNQRKVSNNRKNIKGYHENVHVIKYIIYIFRRRLLYFSFREGYDSIKRRIAFRTSYYYKRNNIVESYITKRSVVFSIGCFITNCKRGYHCGKNCVTGCA